MNDHDIEIFQVGSPVSLGPVGHYVDAVVTAVCIRENCHVAYECSWWNGRELMVAWVEQIMVKRSEKSASVKIGFVKGS